MTKLIVIIVLSLICFALLVSLLLIVSDVKRITEELIYINEHPTNGFVTGSSGLPLIQRLINASNINLKLNRQLQNEQLQQEKKIRSMLTNLTHDIKTPLTVSRGYVQVLGKKLDSKHREQFTRIERNLDSVNYYLRYLMDFNLLQEKSVNLKVKEINVSQLLENEIFNYYDEFSQKKLELVPKIPTGVFWQTDATLLSRIFENLISNILKYGNGQVKVDLNQDHDRLKITFANQGSDISVETNDLLNRFYTQDQLQGSGLGLSIVQSLVVSLGGELEIKTDDGWFKVMVILKNEN
ncbi:sensor histidine kinase [Xylocopilactobacillus apicola]|uniref:histidine kinase n=1 Tax=Xylocopilactobacillus apicola TaxID=2932184 RepID=A0AAU9DP79_9LACO|nr:HAMP domain-containing sensor histidine kinase [Xylocopilactobacillus apicola]BDR57589.1 two-component sensor histidine kinase [Xylocopilactobacillus apicola]